MERKELLHQLYQTNQLNEKGLSELVGLLIVETIGLKQDIIDYEHKNVGGKLKWKH